MGKARRTGERQQQRHAGVKDRAMAATLLHVSRLHFHYQQLLLYEHYRSYRDARWCSVIDTYDASSCTRITVHSPQHGLNKYGEGLLGEIYDLSLIGTHALVQRLVIVLSAVKNRINLSQNLNGLCYDTVPIITKKVH